MVTVPNLSNLLDYLADDTFPVISNRENTDYKNVYCRCNSHQQRIYAAFFCISSILGYAFPYFLLLSEFELHGKVATRGLSVSRSVVF